MKKSINNEKESVLLHSEREFSYQTVLSARKPGCIKCFYPRSDKNHAGIFAVGEQLFLMTGSHLSRPKEKSLDWNDDGTFYTTMNREIDSLIEKGLAREMGDKIEVLSCIPVSAPSTIAKLISGQSVNGWEFFSEIEVLRNEGENKE